MSEQNQSDMLTPKKDWQERFIASLQKLPNVTRAAKAAGINRKYAYQVKKSDIQFAEAWDDALGMSVDNAEAELHRRAVLGVLEPVYHNGKKVGSVREYSDTLLIFLLKTHRPEKYRDSVKLTGSGPNGEIEQKHSGVIENAYDLTKLSLDELLAFRTLAMKANGNTATG